jgi:hypothetical protein
MSKTNCHQLINDEDFLWFDKQDIDEKINRCQEQYYLFSWLVGNEFYEIGYEFGKKADFGEYDFKYYESEWEDFHCNY